MLKNLSDGQLTEKIKSLAAGERKITRQVIEHIAELERRKLYLKSHSSLFEYLTREIGYTNGSAQRRIDAARLLINIPEVAHQIESGALNLSQISKLQMTCREVTKKTGQKVSHAQKSRVLKKIENLKESATELMLAQEFQTEVKIKSKVQIQKDESVRVELTFSKEEIESIRTAQALLSSKTGGGLKETLLEMAKQVIKRSEPKKTSKEASHIRPSNADNACESGQVINNVEQAAHSAQPDTRVVVKSVTPRLKREVRKAHQVCQFRDLENNQICGSKFFLEVDHIKLRSKGGDNSPRNLRMMCKNHNLYRYQQNL